MFTLGWMLDFALRMAWLMLGLKASIGMVSIHEYQVRPRKDRLGVHLICDALPFRCALLSSKDAVADAIDYAKLFSGSNAAVIRVYDDVGNVIETHEHKGERAR